jgi:trehalose utilization protein
MAIKTIVWCENVHDRENGIVKSIYPDGMHSVIAAALAADTGLSVSTATLDEPEHGLTIDRLKDTDVLTWWGHKAHGDVSDKVVERVAERVWEGMGLIVLHSGHFSKIFTRLMGTPCSLQ